MMAIDGGTMDPHIDPDQNMHFQILGITFTLNFKKKNSVRKKILVEKNLW